MFGAQWHPYIQPRRWITSGGLGSMGFGLPSALGCAVAFDGKNGREKMTVVDIDGDGSFMMNVQVGVHDERARVGDWMLNGGPAGTVDKVTVTESYGMPHL